ncbi:MAG: TlyA family RNA methyltransferase [Candidatus Eremiobacteraeota bacterium]|nr:TlyA family RNA methyltransferase [Candidatus Eremiobacteraeota bacterium]MBC5804234.1 TlyA family RNA methyltransferase [Candidatus Eremiobacteraeota bacterium]MBC5820389.1 TlyA family RNA methyltransferase [Candidatus Eremiobacteraeota bacterium]
MRLDETVAAAAGVTRSRARALIMAGRVRVQGRPATKPGMSVSSNAALDVERAHTYVSRGGEKLQAVLAEFSLDVRGLRALDVGASTGGFTDALLAHGAAHVTALDVGYGQLALPLRDDPRVTVVERTNFRLLQAGALGEPFALITIDASFISVVTLIDRARAFLTDDGSIVALVKPQFQAGRRRLGGRGVVRDGEVHRAILREVRDAISTLGLAPTVLAPSALRGPAGNVEFFTLVRQRGIAYDDDAIEAALAAAPQALQ